MWYALRDTQGFPCLLSIYFKALCHSHCPQWVTEKSSHSSSALQIIQMGLAVGKLI